MIHLICLLSSYSYSYGYITGIGLWLALYPPAAPFLNSRPTYHSNIPCLSVPSVLSRHIIRQRDGSEAKPESY